MATEDGTKFVKLDLNEFSSTANSFCMKVGVHTSRTLFLNKFSNILPVPSSTTSSKPDRNGECVSVLIFTYLIGTGAKKEDGLVMPSMNYKH